MPTIKFIIYLCNDAHAEYLFLAAKFLIRLYSGVTIWELACFITPELCTEAKMKSNRIKDESYYYGKGYNNGVLCTKNYLHTCSETQRQVKS